MGRQPFYLDPLFAPLHKSFSAGEKIFEQDGTDGHLCILVKGELQVQRDGRTVGVVAEPGAILGEMSLILGVPYTASVLATSDATLAVIPREKLKEVVGRIPAFSVRMMRTLARRLQQTNQRLADLESTYDALWRQVENGSLLDNPEGQLVAGIDGICDEPEEEQASRVQDQGRSPLFAREVRCPAHEGDESFSMFRLRTGSLTAGSDPYDIIEYTGATPGYAFVDYTLQEVHVCPVCFFASNLTEAFCPVDRTSASLFTIHHWIRQNLQEERGRREALAARLDDRSLLFSDGRPFHVACVAYRLAIMTARTFFDTDPLRYSIWGFRISTYYLKLAQIMRRYHEARGEEQCLTSAFELLQKHLGKFDGNQYFLAMFRIVALSRVLEGEAQAETHLVRFRRVREKYGKRLNARMNAVVDEYFSKAEKLVSGESTT